MGIEDRLVVTLNPSGVLAPALRAIRDTVEVVTFCLNAIEQGDLSRGPEAELMRFEMHFSDEMSVEARHASYTHWLLSKGFQDLARGIRQTLEEAFFYNGIVAQAGALTTLASMQAAEKELRKAATNMQSPALLSAVNKGLTAPLHYEREFSSLGRMRNCLEHREGIVGERDVDPDTQVLRLGLPRLRMFYEDEGRQIELGRGSHVEKDTAVMMQVVVTEREFKLGERVTFNASEFHDIGFGFNVIANDLMSKLPKIAT
jgi:hypothetical protein